MSYGGGAAKGPRAILEASAQLEFYDEEVDREVAFEVGIATRPSIDVAGLSGMELRDLLKDRTAAELSEGRVPVILGGEHTVSIGPIEASLAKYPDLHIVHVDAHSDLRLSYQDNPYSHASVMRRVCEMKVPLHSVGIRAQCREEADFIKQQGLHILFEHTRRSDPQWCEAFLEQVPAEAPVYFSIDLDGLDPAIMPSTGTPVPGGLSWPDILKLSRALTKRCRLVAFDVVELAPQGHNHAPDFLAAQLIYKIICYNETR